MKLTDEQILRYSRQITLLGVGRKGQRKLSEAKVFPAALYVAAAAVAIILVLICLSPFQI